MERAVHAVRSHSVRRCSPSETFVPRFYSTVFFSNQIKTSWQHSHNVIVNRAVKMRVKREKLITFHRILFTYQFILHYYF